MPHTPLQSLLTVALAAAMIQVSSPTRDEYRAPNKTPRHVETVARLDYLQRGEVSHSSPNFPPITGIKQDDTNLFDVEVDTVEDARQDSQWSLWSVWSPCSRSCGSGVSSRVRKCISRSNDPHCEGTSIEHRLCNTPNCPQGSQGFRELQCSRQNGKLFLGRTFRWIPFSGNEGNSCELTCMAKRFHFYHSFGTALDGTVCGDTQKGICIKGECMRIGCDNIIGSNMTQDVCGVCGGNNGTCFRYQNVVDRLPKQGSTSGYNKIATIPIGATHVQVNDYNKNYLALVEVEENTEHYVINGNWIVSWTGDFKTAGTVVSYSRDGDKESFQIVGPTKTELRIMVLCLGQQQPLVQYEYWLPNSEKDKDERFAELKMQRHTIIHVPDEEDYRRQIIAAGLDFDAVQPPTLPPSTTATTLPSTSTTIYATTQQLTASETTPSVTTTVRTRLSSRIKTGIRRTGARQSTCTSCKKTANKKKQLCDSDFAVHARILPRRRLQRGRYVRYEVEIFNSYKSNSRLSRREYIWMSSTCCPRLRPYRHYLLMGRTVKVTNTNGGTLGSARGVAYETKLLVEQADYWYAWRKYHIRMERLTKHINCKRYRYMAARYYKWKLSEG